MPDTIHNGYKRHHDSVPRNAMGQILDRLKNHLSDGASPRTTTRILIQQRRHLTPDSDYDLDHLGLDLLAR